VPNRFLYNWRARAIVNSGNARRVQNILLGQNIILHTDHKIQTTRIFHTKIYLQKKILVEEYDVEFLHIKGVQIVDADGL
jgi:hypothetical protein